MSVEVETRSRARFLPRGVRRLLGTDDPQSSTNTVAVSPDTPVAHVHAMFQGAQNTTIQRPIFNIYAAGTSTAAGSHSDSRTLQQSTSGPSTVDTPITTHWSPDLVLPVDPIPAPQTSPEVYVRHLMTKNRGYPLWIPSPNMHLPAAYRASGVSIGDVGVITPEGGFSYLFNVFHEATHPINVPMRLPMDFVPFARDAGVRSSDIEMFIESRGGGYLADESLVRMDAGDDRFKTILKTSATDGAVLMMPEPVYASKLQCIVPFRKYVRDNIRSWYRFVKTVLGRNVDNGALRVVEGCRKSTAFGIATVSNGGASGASTELTFSVDHSWIEITGCKYGWYHKGSAEVNSGPSLVENEEILQELLRAGGLNPQSDPVFRNQCLFVDTLNLTLQEEEWNHIDDDNSVSITTCEFPSTRTGQTSPSAQYSMSPRGVQSNCSLSPSSVSENGKGMDDPRQQSACTLGRLDESASLETMPSSKTRQLFDPSDVLAQFLLLMVPEATSVALRSNDWGPYMTSSVQTYAELIDSVLLAHVIYEDNGMIYLSPKEGLLHKQRQGLNAAILPKSLAKRNSPHNLSFTSVQSDQETVEKYMTLISAFRRPMFLKKPSANVRPSRISVKRSDIISITHGISDGSFYFGLLAHFAIVLPEEFARQHGRRVFSDHLGGFIAISNTDDAAGDVMNVMSRRITSPQLMWNGEIEISIEIDAGDLLDEDVNPKAKIERPDLPTTGQQSNPDVDNQTVAGPIYPAHLQVHIVAQSQEEQPLPPVESLSTAEHHALVPFNIRSISEGEMGSDNTSRRVSMEMRSESGSGSRTRGGILRKRLEKARAREASHSVAVEAEMVEEPGRKSCEKGSDIETSEIAAMRKARLQAGQAQSASCAAEDQKPAQPTVTPLLQPMGNRKGVRQLEDLLEMEQRTHQLASRLVSTIAFESVLPPVITPPAPSLRPDDKSPAEGLGKSPSMRDAIAERASTSRKSNSTWKNLQDPKLVKGLNHVMGFPPNGNRRKRVALATSDTEDDDEYEPDTDVEEGGLDAALSSHQQRAFADHLAVVRNKQQNQDDEWSGETEGIDDDVSPPSQSVPRQLSVQPSTVQHTYSRYHPTGQTGRAMKQTLVKQEQQQQNRRPSNQQRDTIEINKLPSESFQSLAVEKLRNDSIGGLTRLLNPGLKAQELLSTVRREYSSGEVLRGSSTPLRRVLAERTIGGLHGLRPSTSANPSLAPIPSMSSPFTAPFGVNIAVGVGRYQKKGPPADNDLETEEEDEDDDWETEEEDENDMCEDKSSSHPDLVAEGTLYQTRGQGQFGYTRQRQDQPQRPPHLYKHAGPSNHTNYDPVPYTQSQQHLPTTSLKILGFPYNLPMIAIPSSPRTTRRVMVHNELSESVRQGVVIGRKITRMSTGRRTSTGEGAEWRQPLSSEPGMVQLVPKGTLRAMEVEEDEPRGSKRKDIVDEPDPAMRRALQQSRNKSWADTTHTSGW